MALVYWLVDGLKLPVMPSGIVAIALCSAANFLLADRWVYPKYWETADRSERVTDWLDREL